MILHWNWGYDTDSHSQVPDSEVPNLCKWKHNNNHIWEQILRASDTGTNLMPCCSEVEDHILGTDFGTFLFGLSLGNWVECERVKQQWKKPCLPQASVEMSNIHGWLVISKHPLKDTNRHCLNSCCQQGKRHPNDAPEITKFINESASLGVWFTVISSIIPSKPKQLALNDCIAFSNGLLTLCPNDIGGQISSQDINQAWEMAGKGPVDEWDR